MYGVCMCMYDVCMYPYVCTYVCIVCTYLLRVYVVICDQPYYPTSKQLLSHLQKTQAESRSYITCSNFFKARTSKPISFPSFRPPLVFSTVCTSPIGPKQSINERIMVPPAIIVTLRAIRPPLSCRPLVGFKNMPQAWARSAGPACCSHHVNRTSWDPAVRRYAEKPRFMPEVE